MLELYGSTSHEQNGGQEGRKIQLYSNILILRLENKEKHEAWKKGMSAKSPRAKPFQTKNIANIGKH